MNLYEENYFEEYGNQPFRWKYWESYVRKHYSVDDSILEVGCAYGYLFMYLKDYLHLYGVEISEHALETAKKLNTHAEFKAVTGTKLPYSAETFKLVLAFDVLEHIPTPEDSLKEIYRVLQPGGRVIISTPNTASYSHKKKGKNWFAYGDKTHVSLLPPEQWNKLVTKQGFIIEQAKGIDLFDFPYVRKFFVGINYLLYKLKHPYVSFGDNYLLIAKKP